ncbi:Cytochrome c oxidase subunit 3 [Bienertia sinuspersici]
MFVRWRDVLRESTLEEHHTKVTQLGLRHGFILFIVSEGYVLFCFFWAFFHSSLGPAVEIEGIWVLDPWEILFLNILILILSGVAITWAHHAILEGRKNEYSFLDCMWYSPIFWSSDQGTSLCLGKK